MSKDYTNIRAIERIKARCITDSNGCWVWQGAKFRGYAQIYLPSLNIGTGGHRITYTLVKGEIPKGLVIDHLCRNPSCLNPDHLEAVTAWENTRRGVGPSATRVKATHCVKGHEFTEVNTYHPPKHPQQRYCKQCIRSYNKKYQAKLRLKVGTNG